MGVRASHAQGDSEGIVCEVERRYRRMVRDLHTRVCNLESKLRLRIHFTVWNPSCRWSTAKLVCENTCSHTMRVMPSSPWPNPHAHVSPSTGLYGFFPSKIALWNIPSDLQTILQGQKQDSLDNSRNVEACYSQQPPDRVLFNRVGNVRQ